MLRRLAYLLLLALPMGAGPAGAQTAPEAGVLLQRWMADQREALRAVGRIEVEEQTEHVLDGPFGMRRRQQQTRLSGAPGAPRWNRETLSRRIDGREVSPERFQREGPQRRPGPPAEALLQDLLMPLRLVRRMTPAGPVSPEAADGLHYWRFDVRPRTGRGPVERVTLWFERDQGRLARSRSIVNQPGDGGALVVTTDYERIEGIDLPRHRRVEGTVQTRRRMRRFTLLMQMDAEYRNYRFSGPNRPR